MISGCILTWLATAICRACFLQFDTSADSNNTTDAILEMLELKNEVAGEVLEIHSIQDAHCDSNPGLAVKYSPEF